MKDAIVLTYGGIRGAIGISFALIVSHDTFFDHKFKHILLLHISVCAFLSLVSNFITFAYINLKLMPLPPNSLFNW